MKNEYVVAYVLVVMIVSGVMWVSSWNVSSPISYTGSTTTTTQTIVCTTPDTTQTSGNGSVQSLDYGPLLGNLSAITVGENVYSSQGNLTIMADLLVLNRSLTGSRPVYLVNVTVKEVMSNIVMVGSSGLTTTTITTSGNQTQVGSVLGLVASNGSTISVVKASGEFSATPQFTTVPLGFFESFVSFNLHSSTYGFYPLYRLNSTVATVGSTRMLVTSYEIPSVVLDELIQGCGSPPSSAAYIYTTTDEVIQAGQVPGTDFTLVTVYSARLTFQSNSSSPAAVSPVTIIERVSSFTVG